MIVLQPPSDMVELHVAVVERIVSEHHEPSEEHETSLTTCHCGKWCQYPLLEWSFFLLFGAIFIIVLISGLIDIKLIKIQTIQTNG